MTPDTGIVTLHRSKNYGAFLQAFALQEVLTSLGCTTRFIEVDYEPPLICRWKRELVKLRQEGLFRYRHARVMSKAAEECLRAGASKSDRFERIFVGSDEVWSVRNPNFVSDPAFFGIGLNAQRICSYAPSMGQSTAHDLAGSPERVAGLKTFEFLSGRDDNTVGAVSSLCGRPVVKVLDPTLLLDWRPHVVPFDLSGALVVYTYRFDEPVVRFIRDYAKAKGLRVVAVGMGHPWVDEVVSASPFQFLGALQSAAAVVTDTFHGTIMSSLVEANFAIVDQGAKKKLSQLIQDLALGPRVATDGARLATVLSQRFRRDGSVDAGEQARIRSMSYLQKCVEN